MVRSHAHHQGIHEARTVCLVAENVSSLWIIARAVLVAFDNTRRCPRGSARPLNDLLNHVFWYIVKMFCERVFHGLLQSVFLCVQEYSLLVPGVHHQLLDKLRLRFLELLFLR